MLEKFAIYILRKTKDTYIINCKFDRPFKAKVGETVNLFDNDIKNGTVFERGTYKVSVSKELEE